MSHHPYTLDRWATPDDPESVPIRFADLRKIERACLGIWAIARIVGNSATEPEGTGAEPLEPWISANLLGGIESPSAITLRILQSRLWMGRGWILESR